MTSKYSILLYHGVYSDKSELSYKNSSGKHISESEFSKQIKYVKENFNIISLNQISDAIEGKIKLENDSVAITFDDGFLNNYEVARPVLEKYKVPTTFYISTGFIGSSDLMWTDKLESMIVKNYDSIINLDLGEIGSFSLKSINQNIKEFLGIKLKLKMLEDSHKNKILKDIEGQLKTKSEGHDLYKFMNWDQVREMNKSDLFDFGAHTVNHISLAKAPTSIMQQQITESISDINKELGVNCNLFSYPEGQEDDFNEEVIAFLKINNIKFCPTAIEGYNIIGKTNPYYLKRFMVGFEKRPFPF